MITLIRPQLLRSPLTSRRLLPSLKGFQETIPNRIQSIWISRIEKVVLTQAKEMTSSRMTVATIKMESFQEQWGASRDHNSILRVRSHRRRKDSLEKQQLSIVQRNHSPSQLQQCSPNWISSKSIQDALLGCRRPLRESQLTDPTTTCPVLRLFKSKSTTTQTPWLKDLHRRIVSKQVGQVMWSIVLPLQLRTVWLGLAALKNRTNKYLRTPTVSLRRSHTRAPSENNFIVQFSLQLN